MNKSRIYIAIFLAVACMSTSSIIIKSTHAPAIIIAFYRVVFTAGIAFLIGNRQVVKSARQIVRNDWYYIIGSGVFLALHFAFWNTSLSYTSVSSSVLFTNLQVIFVIIFSLVFLKEKLNPLAIAGIMAALAGSILIVSGDLGAGKFFGDMLALASGLFIAIYYIIGRRVRSRIDAVSYTCFTAGVAILVLWLISLAGKLNMTGYPPREWFMFFLLALAAGICGHLVLNWALKYVKAPIVSVSILGESVGATILAFFIFGESLLWYQIAGGLLILTGIYATNQGDGSRGSVLRSGSGNKTNCPGESK